MIITPGHGQEQSWFICLAGTVLTLFGAGIDIAMLLLFIVAFQVAGNRLYRKYNE